MNGVSQESELPLDHYQEILKDKPFGTDVISGRKVLLKESLKLAPKEVLVLEL